MFVPDDFEFDL